MKAPKTPWITFLKNINEKTPTLVCTRCDERHVIRLPFAGDDFGKHITGFTKLHEKCEVLEGVTVVLDPMKDGMMRAAHIAEMFAAMSKDASHIWAYKGIANAIRNAIG